MIQHVAHPGRQKTIPTSQFGPRIPRAPPHRPFSYSLYQTRNPPPDAFCFATVSPDDLGSIQKAFRPVFLRPSLPFFEYFGDLHCLFGAFRDTNHGTRMHFCDTARFLLIKLIMTIPDRAGSIVHIPLVPDPPLETDQNLTPPCILRRFGQAAFSTRFAQGGSDTHQPHHASILRHRAPGRHRADDTVHSRFGRAAYSSPLMPDPPLPCGSLMTETRNGPKFIPHHVFCGGSVRQHFPHVSRTQHASILRHHHAPGRQRADDTVHSRFGRAAISTVPSCLIQPSLVGC